jgi:hypothetical protein
MVNAEEPADLGLHGGRLLRLLPARWKISRCLSERQEWSQPFGTTTATDLRAGYTHIYGGLPGGGRSTGTTADGMRRRVSGPHLRPSVVLLEAGQIEPGDADGD